jgi:hypothetical protein
MKDMNAPSSDNQPFVAGSTQSEALAPSVKYGAMVVGPDDINGKKTVLQRLGVNYIRYTLIVSDWTGSDGGYDSYVRDGYKIVCNICYNEQVQGGGRANHFVTNLTTYKNKLNSIFTKYHPEVAVIENEETNQTYYNGSMGQYINQLRAAIQVAHSKGVKVADGGIHPQGICYFVWKDYKSRGMDAQAQQWMNLTFNSQMKSAAEHPERNANLNHYWRQIDTLLTAFTTMDLDYVNMHIYEPINDVGNGVTTIPGCIQTMAQYIKQRTGKPAMSNECGQRNTNTTLVTSMLRAFQEAKYPYSIWFSKDADNTRALQNTNLSLRPNGVAYSNFVATH